MHRTRILSLFAVLLIMGLGLMVPLAAASSSEGGAFGMTTQNDGGSMIVADVTDGNDSDSQETSHRLIVQLKSPSLSEWSAQTRRSRAADGRLDVRSSAAQAYIAQLEAEQAAFVRQMLVALPGSSVSRYINENGQAIESTYQVAVNGMSVNPGETDPAVAMKVLSDLPGVKMVYRDFAYSSMLYTSTQLINAPALWDMVGGQADGGRGVKVASMDGGVHHMAGMFDGTGYSYPEGFPAGGLGDTNNNNGKIIASRAYFREWDPAAPGDENVWPGQNGTPHGVHTAGIAAGNVVTDADYLGLALDVSGVAPAAWVMSYRVFYASVNNNGSFFTSEGIAALEDIVKDGADVLNNSWGEGPTAAGGEFDVLDTALINAANAGVFVSMSAGNSGPNNGTTDHPSDEYIVVAASTTSGTFAAGELNVTAPTPVTDTLQNIPFANASFGGSLGFGLVHPFDFVTAASVDPANFEGCSPWTGTPFAGKAALISRGACNFSDKLYYAQLAGAKFVVVHNDARGDDLVGMSCGSFCGAGVITVPGVFIGNTPGLLMVEWYATNGNASALEMNNQPYQAGSTADQIAGFSSRGPGVGNVLKPDIAAPGVNILSQGYAIGVSGEDRHLGYGQVSGTSMASPHVAGAAALLRQLHPDWSNAAIKSALMSTAKYMEVYNGDGTPAQPLDMGAGRMDLTHAADPGVILDPPSVSFGRVMTGTDIQFVDVKVTNITSDTETYNLSTLYTGGGFDNMTALPGFGVQASVSLDAGESKVISVEFDPSMSMGIGDNQGYIVMEGDNGHHAHMAVWARVTPPMADADVLIIDNDGSGSLGISNYLAYYTSALDALGMSYDVLNADANFGNAATIPEAAVLSSYKAIIYFTGDNYQPDGTFTVSTALTAVDMDRLTEYANKGGIIIAMGQDMSGVLASDATDNGTFFYNNVLGANWLQDSVTGFALPSLPVVPLADVPPAFENISLDLSGSKTNEIHLDGTHENPPVATTTHGDALAIYNGLSGGLTYQITISAGDPVSITKAHIHTGTIGNNGPSLHSIFPFTETQVVTDSLTWSGQVALSAEEAATLLGGGLYINVHSTANPSGEVRGQLIIDEVSGDGAGNQLYIDEMHPFPSLTDVGDPNMPEELDPYLGLFRYPGNGNLTDGVVGMAHRDQPSLEHPGIAYFGRSIYTSFGLEGVNNGGNSTSREMLLGTFLQATMDEPQVMLEMGMWAHTTVFTATVDSHINGTVITDTGISYRWDFGDGGDYVGPVASNIGGHHYALCGTYTARVEATDRWGNRVIGSSMPITVDTDCHDVEMEAVEMDGTEMVGSMMTYDMELTNSGTSTDMFDLVASGNNWETMLSVTGTRSTPTQLAVELAAGASATIQVAVQVPAGAAEGDTDTVNISATSRNENRAVANLALTTTATETPTSITIDQFGSTSSSGTSLWLLLGLTVSGLIWMVVRRRFAEMS
ncbi:MAG: S8 family serine peptidase [Ardenticatenaceae bacterium]